MYIHAYDKADAVASEQRRHRRPTGSTSAVLVPRDAERAAFIVLGRPPTRWPPTQICRIGNTAIPDGLPDGVLVRSRRASAQIEWRTRHGPAATGHRGTRLHAVLVRRKRERALFAAGKNRRARVDDNRDAALFNGNRKCDGGHRFLWCTPFTSAFRGRRCGDQIRRRARCGNVT